MLRIYAPAMYLEMARAFAKAKVEVQGTPDLQSPHDLPATVQLHLQFILTCGVVIFGIAYLEASVNSWLATLLDDWSDNSVFDGISTKKKDVISSGVKSLRDKYRSQIDREKLFKLAKLREKIKLLYRTLGVQPLYEEKDAARQRLWQDFCLLEKLRNDIIHLKSEFIESPDLIEFLRLESEERQRIAQVPATMIRLMTFDLPVADVNSPENVIISEIFLQYADKPILEGFMLGMEYTDEEKRKWLSRNPHSFWNKPT